MMKNTGKNNQFSLAFSLIPSHTFAMEIILAGLFILALFPPVMIMIDMEGGIAKKLVCGLLAALFTLSIPFAFFTFNL